MTKIDIISGFLGAGKTTLIKKLLAEAFGGEKLVLIENEFGEIGIDGGFLKDSGVQVTEMNSGCICCSLVGDFGKALAEVLEKFTPDRIVIEPSGVGKLSDVIKAVEGVDSADIKLNSFTVVVDAKKSKMYMKNFGEFFNNQVEHAGTIVLSRTQKMTEAKLEACVAMLREKNRTAAIITTPWEELKGEQILAAMQHQDLLLKEDVHGHAEHHHDHEDHEHEHDHSHEHGHHHDHDHHHGEDCGCHDHHHHHADEVFQSWGRETPKKFTEAELSAALTGLGDITLGTVLRSKGIVPCADGGWLHFDYVPGAPEIRKGSADYTGRLCVIGADLDEDRLAELFGVDAWKFRYTCLQAF